MLFLVGVLGRAADLLPSRVTTPSARSIGQLAVIAVLTVPVTLWFAWWEAAPRGATPGKRLLGLRVSRLDGGALSWPRSLLRSAVRIAVPWELAHTGVWNSLVWLGPEGPVNLVLFAVANGLLVLNLVLLFVGARRPPLRPLGRHGRAGGLSSLTPWRCSAHDARPSKLGLTSESVLPTLTGSCCSLCSWAGSAQRRRSYWPTTRLPPSCSRAWTVISRWRGRVGVGGRGCRPVSDPAVGARDMDGFVAVGRTELGGCRGQVVAYRAWGEGGTVGDLLDGDAVGGELEDVGFAGCQGAVPGADGFGGELGST